MQVAPILGSPAIATEKVETPFTTRPERLLPLPVVGFAVVLPVHVVPLVDADAAARSTSRPQLYALGATFESQVLSIPGVGMHVQVAQLPLASRMATSVRHIGGVSVLATLVT